MGFFQHIWDVLLTSMFGVTVATSAPTYGIQNYSAEHVKSFMTALNEVRSSVLPPAAKMTYLKWDNKLAEEAKKLVAKCDQKFDTGHSSVLAVSHLELNPEFSVENLVETWMVASYNLTTDICQSTMRLCNNYKLLIKDDNSKVGCATNVCPGESNKPIHQTACKFDKLLTSGVPYRTSTKSCTECAKDQKCVRNLCMKLADAEEEEKATAAGKITSTTAKAATATDVPVLTHNKPVSGNSTDQSNATTNAIDDQSGSWYGGIMNKRVSLAAFVTICVLLAITFIVAVSALILACRLKSRIPINNKNF